ncbi:hypothetical protein GCM10025867_45620 (plasmid) [Frondihabitans sucicola]|uniref:Uncharacterized protein n=1 Tax=Frondihabitans sucicola TaxID=1268041 RepID=A0ABN6Y8N1_9MICO|nr:hypothetical protein [Frondihabitans sucicola]BDZ52321.1 hypothetical protein GCM10025867_45620 [Frondihabitans sucicola]
MRRGKCNRCELRKDVLLASHFGGGSFRRPGRFYRSSICEDCAIELKSMTTEGDGRHTISQWGIGSLETVIQQFADIRARDQAAAKAQGESL